MKVLDCLHIRTHRLKHFVHSIQNFWSVTYFLYIFLHIWKVNFFVKY